MLVYRGCDIGTAKPSEAEKRGIVHHLIDIFEPEQPFSAADYSALCEAAEAEILNRGKMPVICGGTGLYINALTRPLSFSERSDEKMHDIKRNLESKRGSGKSKGGY